MTSRRQESHFRVTDDVFGPFKFLTLPPHFHLDALSDSLSLLRLRYSGLAMFNSSQQTDRRNGKQVARNATPAEVARKILVKELALSLAVDAIPWCVSFAEKFQLEDDVELMEEHFGKLARAVVSKGDGFGEPEQDASPARATLTLTRPQMDLLSSLLLFLRRPTTECWSHQSGMGQRELTLAQATSWRLRICSKLSTRLRCQHGVGETKGKASKSECFAEGWALQDGTGDE